MNNWLQRWLTRIWSGRYYVGSDLRGNRFFESPALEGSSHTKRVVKYVRQDDMYAYASGIARLPVQWTAWMAHTRRHPPSIEELQIDLARQQRTAVLAAQIEARDSEEQVRQMEAARQLETARFDHHTSTPLLHDASTQTALKSDQGPDDVIPAHHLAHKMRRPEPTAPKLAHEVPSDPILDRSTEHARQRYQQAQATDEAQPWSPKVHLRRERS